MQVQVHIVNAFTLNNTGGNPAGVVLDADHLSSEQKQDVASRTGLSETAFVSKSAIADVRLEFFTPSRQIAHCGHATIATFAFLQQGGHLPGKTLSSKETIDGVRQIRLEGLKVFMEQKGPVFSVIPDEDREQVLYAAGLHEADLVGMTICNTGNGFLLLELSDITTLQQMRPDQTSVKMLSERYDVVGFYAFVRVPNSCIDATARMFAPAYGIAEESATGMAAGPLAAYLYTTQPVKTIFLIEQGRYMSPTTPSLIEVQLATAAGRIVSLMAGGTAALSETQIHII